MLLRVTSVRVQAAVVVALQAHRRLGWAARPVAAPAGRLEGVA